MRVEVDLQPVEVQVMDSHGNDVRGLSEKDFTLYENGKRQNIAFFDSGNGPVSLAILVDSSNSISVNGQLGSAEAVAAQFARIARPGDEIYAMDFTDQMGPFERLTYEQLLNPSAVSLELAPSEGSAIYDAIATALCHLRASKNPRQAVIVISDGDDQHSRLTLEQLLGMVRTSHAQLFMIGMHSKPEFHFEGHETPKLTLVTGHDIDNPVVVFDRLMKESGAESFIPKSQLGLDEALYAVSDLLRAEYTLAYYPLKTSKKFREIKVKVDQRGARVLAPRFVGVDRESGEPGQGAVEPIHFEEGTCLVSPKFYPYPYESKVTNVPKGMVYRENFADRSSGWPNHDNSHYVSGGYELSNSEEKAKDVEDVPMMHGVPVGGAAALRYHENVVAAYGPWWSDFRVSVTVNAALRPKKHTQRFQFPYLARPAAGLVFRMNQIGYYAMLVSGTAARNNLSVELVKREYEGNSYVETSIMQWTMVDAPPLDDRRSTFRGEHRNAHLPVCRQPRSGKRARRQLRPGLGGICRFRAGSRCVQ